jgi:hypothetical protein
MEPWTYGRQASALCEPTTWDAPSGVEVLLHLLEQAPVRAKVHEVRGDSLSVEVPKAVALPLGGSCRLSLLHDGHERLVTLTATVSSRSEGATQRRYTFTFAAADLDAYLPTGLLALFNRRRAERYQLVRPVAVEVTPLSRQLVDGNSMRPPASGRGVLASLDGASATGCSLLLSRADDARLAASERLLIRIEIAPPATTRDPEAAPDTTRTLCFGVSVLHRVLTADGCVRYGCELDLVDRDGGAALARFAAHAAASASTHHAGQSPAMA